MPDLQQTLSQTFGYRRFRAGQEEVITRLLDGHSVLACFPSGGGKSLCYQLPAVLLKGLTLVISPLLALMKDQLAFLERKNIPAARLDSSQSQPEREAVLRALAENRLKLLYISPERLADPEFRRRLTTPPALLAIDEAHCLSEWGHQFRPAYLRLPQLARQTGAPVLALTATATPRTRADLCERLGIKAEHYICQPLYRPNLELRLQTADEKNQLPALLARLENRRHLPAIVYVKRRREAESLADRLRQNGFAVRCYHAGLPPEEREETQDWFMASRDGCVVATIAFGLGIDKTDIRAIYHLDPPGSLENYAQEIGRAGRDGAEATCEMLVGGAGVTALENELLGHEIDQENLSRLLKQLLSEPEEFPVFRAELSLKYDLEPALVDSALVYLEDAGALSWLAKEAVLCQFALQSPAAEILAHYPDELAKLAADLLCQARPENDKFIISSTTAGLSHAQLTGLLQRLEEDGFIVYRELLADAVYQPGKNINNGEILAQILDRFRNWHEHQRERFRSLLTFLESSDCLTRQLLAYFGEDPGRSCGHCSRCLNQPALFLPPPVALGGKEKILIEKCRQELPLELQLPPVLTRLLCGIATPRLRESGLLKSQYFGRLRHCPWRQVLVACKNPVLD